MRCLNDTRVDTHIRDVEESRPNGAVTGRALPVDVNQFLWRKNDKKAYRMSTNGEKEVGGAGGCEDREEMKYTWSRGVI